jgi:GNAT superfamily N-acetyltransferase
MIHHPEATPPEVALRFPAHLHMNLLPRLQRQGIGSQLLGIWLRAVAMRGATAVHVGVNRSNERACQFWTGHGFADLQATSPGRTRWLGRRVGADAPASVPG